MDVKELIKIGKEIMKILHERGIKMEDYQYLPMVEEFDIMKSMGHKTTYIAAYLASMVDADFWGSSIEDEEHMARYIKDVLCDVDGYEGIVFSRFLADCGAKGNVIFLDRML